MQSKLTIIDIARLSGCSKSTVSRVLTGDPLVKSETRERVIRVMNENGYKRNELARGMVKGRLNIVMVIAGDISNYFYGAAIGEIEKVLYQAGYLIMFCMSEYNAEKELSYVGMAGNFRIAGAILMSPIETPELADRLGKAEFPVLLMNRYLPSCETDAIVQDNFGCAYDAVKHLIDNGHRRILHISSGSGATTSRDRQAGYLAAMSEAGIDASDMIVSGDLTWRSGYEHAKKACSEGGYTAAFIGNDMMTAGFIKGVTECGKRIPADMSIVSFDPSPFLEQLSVKVTTVGCSAPELGRRAAEFFLEHTIAGAEPKRLVTERAMSLGESVSRI